MNRNGQVGKVYNREELLLIGKSVLKSDKTYQVPKDSWESIQALGIGTAIKTRRGKRGGKKINYNKTKYAQVGLLNCQSVCNKQDQLRKVIYEYDLDIASLTETWLKAEGDDSIIAGLTPQNYSFNHKPRTSGSRGGGVAVLAKNELQFTEADLFIETDLEVRVKSFEYIAGYIPFNSTCIRIITIYRIPPSQANGIHQGDFIQQFSSLLEVVSTLPGHLLILGDFNIHWDKPDNPERIEFADLIDTFGLKQLVNEPTHTGLHTLDYVITRSDDQILRSVHVSDTITDHSLIIINLQVTKPKQNRKTKSVRKIKAIDIEKFCSDLQNTSVITSPPENLNDLVNDLHKSLTSLLDNHAPLRSCSIPNRTPVPWFNDKIKTAKIERRKKEKVWRKSRSDEDRKAFCVARNKVSTLIHDAKTDYYRTKIINCAGDQRKII